MDTRLFVENSYTLSPTTIISGLNLRPDITYWPAVDSGDQSNWLVSVGGNEPQALVLEQVAVTFGKRLYFRCSCGRLAAKLYLPEHSHEFLCRQCHGLKYQLSVLNSRSIAGKAIYRMNRMQKLANSRAGIGRIFYNGNFTKRFERFLRQCDHAGYESIVKGANDLKALVAG